MASNRRNNEAFKLMEMADVAIHNENLETCSGAREISLNNEYTLSDGRTACAVGRFSVIFTNGERAKLLALELEDILTLQGVIRGEYFN